MLTIIVSLINIFCFHSTNGLWKKQAKQGLFYKKIEPPSGSIRELCLVCSADADLLRMFDRTGDQRL
ncbi:MAG: hypothetical protein IKC50_04915, partial [Oscillospiraceae bacterium]|nr:hypothetical protein [Oscillospiraceae bacterium]